VHSNRRGARRRIVLRSGALTLLAACGGVLVTVLPAASAAAGPTALTVVRSSSARSASLKWIAGPETSDVVERATNASGPFVTIGGAHHPRHAGASMSARDRSLVASDTYWYRIDGTVGTTHVFSAVVKVAAPTTTTTTATTTTTTTVPTGSGTPVARWWKDFGSPSPDSGTAVATDAGGDLTVAGVIATTVNFGQGAIGVNGITTVALVQYSSSGAVRWDRDLRAESAVVSVDAPTGDVLVAGTFEGAADFGGGAITPVGAQDLFVARYSSAGAYEWARDLGSARGWVIPTAITSASNGDVAFSGYLGGTIDLGTGSLTSTASARSLVLADLAPTGGTRWARVFSPAVDGGALGIAADPAGGFAVAGFATGSVNLGTGSLAGSSTTSALVVASYDASGNARWVKHLGSTGNDRANAVTVAPNGDVVVGGVFGGSIDFGGGALTNPTVNLGYGPQLDTDPFLARYTRSGAFEWAHNFVPAHPEGNGEVVQSVAVDSAGGVMLAGAILDDVNLGTGPLAGATHTYDAFVARYSSAGTPVEAARYGGDNNDQFNGVVSTPTGFAAVGTYGSTIGSLKTTGLEDGVLVSFPS
jgi:hypothetical protein